MKRKSILSKVALLISTIGSAGLLNVHSQSSARNDEPLVKHGVRSPVEAEPSNSLEKVVLRYCRYARAGEFSRLRGLLSPVNLKKVKESVADGSEETAFDIERYLNQRLLEKDIPNAIRTGDQFVIKVRTISQTRERGVVLISLSSNVDAQIQTDMAFDLVRWKGQWKILTTEYRFKVSSGSAVILDAGLFRRTNQYPRRSL